MVKWWRAAPDDWEKTWSLIDKKYQLNEAYRRGSCPPRKKNPDFNIDAKINGAYIVMGLLYGGGDIDKTILISTRCGQDSDCNPANAGGVLCTTIGYANLPERFTSGLDKDGVFSHTAYNFPKLIAACEKIAREAVVKAGGRIDQSAGGETFVIPVQTPKPSKFEQVWAPAPIAHSKFTPEERAKITEKPDK